jgi:serine kinase of HPr protein (carbohydrate metabolism regulator)
MASHTKEELLHATCIAFGPTGVLLLGEPGAGKSDLALRVTSGCAAQLRHLPPVPIMLVADDQVLISNEDGTLIARPHPNIAGKLEVRGIGMLDVPYLPAAEVRLIARLVPFGAVPRLPPEPLAHEMLCGAGVPVLHFDAFEASAPLKLRLAVYQLC